MTTQDRRTLKSPLLNNHMIGWGLFALLMIVSTFFGYQLALWRGEALRVTYLEAKSLLGLADAEDYFQLGRLSRVYGRDRLAVEWYTKVLQNTPADRTATAELAISYGKLGEWALAQNKFSAYFDLGGVSPDVMYWYGRSWEALNQTEQAIDWYYRALLGVTDRDQLGLALYGALSKSGRRTEALSFMAGLRGTGSHRDEHWERTLRDESRKGLSDAPPSAVQLPAVERGAFYLPFQLRTNGLIYFFLVDPDTAHSRISRRILFENGIRVDDQLPTTKIRIGDREIEARRIKLPPFATGLGVIKDEEILTCSDCESVLGKDLLDDWQTETSALHRLTFLHLKRKN